MNIANIEQHMNYLFSAALKKCGNFDDAEDLTSEVLLAALSSPKEIKDIKSWLSVVLNHKYYDILRKKYKQPTVSINLIDESFLQYESEIPDITDAPSREEIRREVAYLSGKYREVIVRHYLKGEKVQDIADSLGIPKGTVLSRLSFGREQMKKGFDSMERYEKQSDQPERLDVSCNGTPGLHDEPWSLVADDMMKQNILIAAYEKPVTTVEIALALGIPTAYIEKSVNDLVKSELMQQVGNKVFTDFIITTPEQELMGLDAQISFAKENYSAIWGFLKDYLDKQRETTRTYNLPPSEQYKLEYYFLLYLFDHGSFRTIQNIFPAKEEFPLRPDGGRWIAMGNRYPADFDFTSYKAAKYCYGGGRYAGEEQLFNANYVALYVYDTQPDLNKYEHGPCGVRDNMLMKLLYIVSRDIPFQSSGLDPLLLKSIPHLTDCGILRMREDKPEVAIPILTKAQYQELTTFSAPYVAGFADLLEPLLRPILPEFRLPLPAHLINRVAEYRTCAWYALPIATIKEAISRGEFPMEHHVPPMVLVIDD